jgi:prepilin-type N-terminal cleavage/methylation domain-containing protein
MNSSDRQKPGFTLIELLIVIVLIAVMAAVIVPAYVRYLSGVRFQAACRHVQDIFAYAREQAIASGSPVTLRFDRQSETFAVDSPLQQPQPDLPTSMSNGELSVANATSQVARPPKTYSLASNQKVSDYNVIQPDVPLSGAQQAFSSPNDLHFQPDGTVEALQMAMVQDDGKMAHFTLQPAAGRLVLDGGVGVNGQ